MHATLLLSIIPQASFPNALTESLPLQCMGSHMLAGIMGDIRDLFFKAEAGYDVFNVVPEKVGPSCCMGLAINSYCSLLVLMDGMQPECS